jgi:ribosomal protein S18 acetylase RimI-like enzyme
MHDIVMRRAEAPDLSRIIELLADDVLGQNREDPRVPPHPRYVEAFAAIGRDANQYLAVVESGGIIVGCLQLSFIPGLSRLGAWRGQIESVRIAVEARNLGLGRRMIEWAIAECRQRQCELVQLTSDKLRLDALRFYEQLGFTASHEGLKLQILDL